MVEGGRWRGKEVGRLGGGGKSGNMGRVLRERSNVAASVKDRWVLLLEVAIVYCTVSAAGRRWNEHL
jgi:hypothetical protein